MPGVSGANEDVFVFTPTSLGTNTAGSYSPALFFDGSLYGLGSNALTGIGLPSSISARTAGGDDHVGGEHSVAFAEFTPHSGQKKKEPGPYGVDSAFAAWGLEGARQPADVVRKTVDLRLIHKTYGLMGLEPSKRALCQWMGTCSIKIACRLRRRRLKGKREKG